MKEPRIWKIEWTDDMSVGIPEIDEDHKRFAGLVNDFNHAIVEQRDNAEIRAWLQRVLDDAVSHFAHEERLFREWGYPDAEGHAAIHARILRDLDGIKAKHVAYGLDPEWIEAGMAVKEILVSHLMTEDMKYAAFYRRTRQAPRAP